MEEIVKSDMDLKTQILSSLI